MSPTGSWSCIPGPRAGWARTDSGTSKAGLIHLTRQTATELASHGITANAVGPGPVETEMTSRALISEMRATYQVAIPAARFGQVEETAMAVAFLVSEQAGYLNGHCLNVDGGLVAAGLELDGDRAESGRRLPRDPGQTTIGRAIRE